MQKCIQWRLLQFSTFATQFRSSSSKESQTWSNFRNTLLHCRWTLNSPSISLGPYSPMFYPVAACTLQGRLRTRRRLGGELWDKSVVSYLSALDVFTGRQRSCKPCTSYRRKAVRPSVCLSVCLSVGVFSIREIQDGSQIAGSSNISETVTYIIKIPTTNLYGINCAGSVPRRFQ